MRFKAEEVYGLVVNTFARGEAHWPVSRADLKGLRLRQVGDAIKIWVATVYCRELAGAVTHGVYKAIKDNIGALFLALPQGFLRAEDWAEAKKINDRERRSFAETRLWVKYYGDEANEEEREFLEGESFGSFTEYLEALPKDYAQIMPHVLGHLSDRYIYVDDTIPVIPAGNASEQRDMQYHAKLVGKIRRIT